MLPHRGPVDRCRTQGRPHRLRLRPVVSVVVTRELVPLSSAGVALHFSLAQEQKVVPGSHLAAEVHYRRHEYEREILDDAARQPEREDENCVGID
jgi:hypothetical protein